MTAITPKATNHAGLGPLDSRFVRVAELPWDKALFEGIEFKTLMMDREQGLMTVLMRMAPGARLPDHEHVLLEQTYVLEGRLVGLLTLGQVLRRAKQREQLAHA